MRFTFPILTVILLTLGSCGGIIKSYIRNDEKNMPPDFGKEKTTLVVIQQKKSAYNKDVESIIKKYYFGEYVFVPYTDLTKDPYQDTKKYRYLLNDDVSYIDKGGGSRSFRVSDRATQKSWGTGVSSGASWKTVLKEYVKKLEAQRKNNSGN